MCQTTSMSRHGMDHLQGYCMCQTTSMSRHGMDHLQGYCMCQTTSMVNVKIGGTMMPAHPEMSSGVNLKGKVNHFV